MRRDATRVIYDILTLGARGASKTQITIRANLSHKLVEKYTIFLVKRGLLGIESDFGGTRYLLTEKGEYLFRLLQEVERELSDFYGEPHCLRMRPSKSRGNIVYSVPALILQDS